MIIIIPIFFFQLGVEKKKVTVRKFKNMKLIDLREYYQKDGKWLPGSKGLSLTLDQWNALVSKMIDINEALSKIDDTQEFNIMKAQLDRKEKALEQNALESAAMDAISANSLEEDDEDVEGVEFEDVSEAPAAKKAKREET